MLDSIYDNDIRNTLKSNFWRERRKIFSLCMQGTKNPLVHSLLREKSRKEE